MSDLDCIEWKLYPDGGASFTWDSFLIAYNYWQDGHVDYYLCYNVVHEDGSVLPYTLDVRRVNALRTDSEHRVHLVKWAGDVFVNRGKKLLLLLDEEERKNRMEISYWDSDKDVEVTEELTRVDVYDLAAAFIDGLMSALASCPFSVNEFMGYTHTEYERGQAALYEVLSVGDDDDE